MGCPCFIALTATKNGEYLEIKDANHTHNHTTSRVTMDYDIAIIYYIFFN